MPSLDLNRALRRIDPALPAFLLAVRAAIEGEAWAAGGFARDVIARRRPLDLDLAVAGGARANARRLATALGGHAFPLDEDRQTFRVTLADGPMSTIDVAELRGPGIEADLAARDFTINAMAAALTANGLGPLLDPFGGREDLRARLVRMVSKAALSEDPLRLLRAPRLAVEMGIDIEDATARAIRAAAPSLLTSAAERRRDELMRIFASADAAGGVRMMDSLGLLDVLLPEFTRARGVTQPGGYHFYDVFDHSIEALAVADGLLSQAEPRSRMARAMRRAFWQTFEPYGLHEYFALTVGGQSRLALTKFATLLHDVAKPETKGVDDDGRMRFLGHADQGAAVSRQICRRLRLGNRETAFVARLVEEHLRPAQLSQSGPPSERAIFRFFRDLGEAAPAVLMLSLADAAAAMGPRLTLSRWKAHLAYIGYVLQRAYAQPNAVVTGRRKRHFLSGDTLIKVLGIAPGPVVGRLLAAIDEAAGAGDLHTQEEAIQLARQLQEQGAVAGRDRKTGIA